ncbi:uncharacterized protein LOC111633722 [Centruroides sculpturatus]|uniref:uncharacterized protein LOC111633722 n=1 Tax=Centruroides sculpturatus TaxID=218467 RepID=UPI000C6E48A0|nr:uncharacterized protein LOC111633722 [Centruroides sculpturatus]
MFLVYNLPIDNITTNIIADIDKSVKDLTIKKEEKGNLLTTIIQNLMHLKQNNKHRINKYKIFLHNTINFLKTNNLSIIKADKTDQLIIIDNNNLQQKTIEQINNINYIKLNNNPYEDIKKELINLVKNIYANNNLSENNKNYILNFKNNRTPKLNIRLKTHKNEEKFRPLVDFKFSILYNLEQYIKQQLTSIDLSKYTVKNADDVINRLLKIQKSNTDTLISLDVKNMYPNIKWKLIEESLTMLNVDKTLINLIHFAYTRNYFQANTNFYRQVDGISMGSKMGPKLAELAMINIDEKINNIPGIKLVMRYADDYLIIYNNRITNDNTILNTANKFNENIQFDIEIENNKKINFLDITIMNTLNNFSFITYKKPCNVNKTINYYSHVPEYIKRNIYTMELKNIYTRISDNKWQKIKIKELETKFLLNDYPKSKLNTWQKQYWENRFNTKYKSDKKYKTFPYIKNIFEGCNKSLKKDNISLAPSLTNKISHSIHYDINKQHNNKLNALKTIGTVYKLECNCQNPKTYIGETGRSLETRIKEHMAAIRLKHNTSPWYYHTIDYNCQINKNNTKVLHVEKDTYKRKFKEHIEIKKHPKENLINVSEGMSIDPQWYKLIENASTR